MVIIGWFLKLILSSKGDHVITSQSEPSLPGSRSGPIALTLPLCEQCHGMASGVQGVATLSKHPSKHLFAGHYTVLHCSTVVFF